MEDRFKSISTKELEKKIEKRQLQITQIIDFAKKIIGELGEIKSRREESAHTNIKRELNGFEHFYSIRLKNG